MPMPLCRLGLLTLFSLVNQFKGPNALNSSLWTLCVHLQQVPYVAVNVPPMSERLPKYISDKRTKLAVATTPKLGVKEQAFQARKPFRRDGITPCQIIALAWAFKFHFTYDCWIISLSSGDPNAPHDVQSCKHSCKREVTVFSGYK
ncbi:hypothetical protein C8J57DRAFT_1248537 [Mycena rebaudengoi]|nr:hypothetical protein C8J57DRAFT_1248537 [Mycena rebaudengoi]